MKSTDTETMTTMRKEYDFSGVPGVRGKYRPTFYSSTFLEGSDTQYQILNKESIFDR